MSREHLRSAERPASTVNRILRLLVGLQRLVAGPAVVAQEPESAARVTLYG